MITILSRRQPVSYPNCHIDIPEGISLLRDEMALPLAAGSAVVKGVKVTVQTRDACLHLVPNRPYLFVAQICGNGVVRTPYGPYGVLAVAADDRLSALVKERPGFLKDLFGLGTTNMLRERLHGLGAGPSND